MVRFKNNTRVRVANPCNDHAALHGRIGIVRRLRVADHQAWVEMLGEPIPMSLRCFLEGDERANHVLLDPFECERA